jgi:hypothetical protein
MSLLQVQQFNQSRFPSGSSGSGGHATVLLALAVIAMIVLAETERWLRDRSGS